MGRSAGEMCPRCPHGCKSAASSGCGAGCLNSLSPGSRPGQALILSLVPELVERSKGRETK